MSVPGQHTAVLYATSVVSSSSVCTGPTYRSTLRNQRSESLLCMYLIRAVLARAMDTTRLAYIRTPYIGHPSGLMSCDPDSEFRVWRAALKFHSHNQQGVSSPESYASSFVYANVTCWGSQCVVSLTHGLLYLIGRWGGRESFAVYQLHIKPATLIREPSHG